MPDRSTPQRALIAAAFAWFLLGGTAGACTINGTPLISLGSKTSFDARVASPNAGSGSSGITCPGAFALLSNQYIFLTVTSVSSTLTEPVSGDTIALSVSTVPGGSPLAVGTSGNLAASGALTSTGVNGEIALFASLGAAGNVSAGTYTGTVNLRWHFATCNNILLGVCVGSWNVSAGITQSCVLGVCTLNTGTLPGTGSPATVTFSLTVTRDCRFDADDVDFGSAPFVESFSPVSGNVRITCTKGTTYTAGLSGGGNSSGGRRRMASGANRLQYDVFRPGNILWSTTLRAAQTTPAAGNTPETFPYEARIYPDQPAAPLGSYSDTLIIDVTF
ncbi:MAG: spore coat protein U domain-containing protein [Gammaproteobacteria bacterium]